MTKLLTKAFAKISKMPERDQDMLASWILEEIKSEERWAKLFEKSHALLEKLGDEALQDDTDGKTEELDPENL